MSIKPCYRDIGDCIKGDSIYIECRKRPKEREWKLFQKTHIHKGSCCKIKKGAEARILQSYTNVEK